MTNKAPRKIIYKIPAAGLLLLLLAVSFLPFTGAILGEEGEESKFNIDPILNYQPQTDPLVKAGYRPRFQEDGHFLQTPEPMPEDAVMHPYGWTPKTTLSSNSRNDDYTHYYDGTVVDVYVDMTSGGGGDLSSNEENLLDRIIDDFINYSWPRVKDYFDPDDVVEHVDFLVHKIDGPSGIGGYYQPGTDEFHLDRDDFSWGGIIAAHEFQHYTHRQYDYNENLWVDEGCADFGAYLVYGITQGIASHVYAYLNWAPRHSLVVDDATFYYDSTTSYYGSSFLFQLYLAEHYGGKNYTNGLVRSSKNGISGVNAGLAASGTSDRFEEVFSKWMVALSVNDDNAGDGDTYSYNQKTYPNGQMRLPISRSHTSSPVTSSFSGDNKLKAYSVNSIRFSSPPKSGETYRLNLQFNSGSPIGAIYYESNPPRSVDHVEFGGSRSKTIDLDGWGTQYNSFRLITSSTSGSDLSYTLDILDLEPPVSQFSISPKFPNGENGWYVSSPVVTLSSEASAKLYYSFNGGEDQLYSQPFYVPDGTWNISYHAVDKHDNIEVSRFFELEVDTSIPSSSMVVDPDMPEDSWYTEAPAITLNTAHPGAVIMYKFGNEEYSEYETPVSPPEGYSTFFWKSVDQAGNEESEKSRSFQVDSIPPTLEYELYPHIPDGKNGYYRTNPTLTLTSEDAQAMYYSFNGGQLVTYTKPVTVPDGSHRIRMVSIDRASNRGDDVIIDVMVDTTVPSLEGSFPGWEYDVDNSSSWITVAPSLEVSGTEETMFINYTVNGGPNQDYQGIIQIDEGITEIWVYGEDEAGNPAQPINYFFKVDLKTPFVEAEVSEDLRNGWYVSKSVEIDFTLSGEDDRSSPVQVEYQWSGEDPKTFRDPISIPEGEGTLFYWATDAAGNKMDTRSIDFKKDSVLPAISMVLQNAATGQVIAGTAISVDLSGSDDENGITFHAVDFTGSGDVLWTPDFTFTHTYNEPGTYEITGYVKDPAGNIREKTTTIEVMAPEEEEPEDNENEENGSSSVILLVMGSIVLLVILGAVLVFVIVRRKGHAETAKQPEQPPSPPVHGLPPGLLQNPQVRRGKIPPPPSPPGEM
jgi:hypothetical protein